MVFSFALVDADWDPIPRISIILRHERCAIDNAQPSVSALSGLDFAKYKVAVLPCLPK